MNWEFKKYPVFRSAVIGNLVFLSGSAGVDLKTGAAASAQFEKQVTVALDNIRLALEEAGSSLENIIKTYIFLKDTADSCKLWQILPEYFRKHAPALLEAPPAVCITGVKALAKPGCLVEIDTIAVLSPDMPGWEVKKFPVPRRGALKPGMPFISESVAVGNLLFLSAIDAVNPEIGDVETRVFEEQWHTSLDKASAALDRAGTSMSNIVKTLHFQCGLEGLLAGGQDQFRSHSPASDRLWKTELEYFDQFAPHLLDEPPGSTFLKVPGLPNPGALGQTDVIAVLSRYMKGWEVRKYPTYIGRRGFPRHIGDVKKYYTNTVKVGNLVIVSGQTPTDNYTARIESDKFEDQMRVTLNNLKESLEETGASLDTLVKTHILLPDPANTAAMRRLELEFYRKYAPALEDEPPASTVTHPLSLASPKMQIEIEAIACLPS